MTLVENIIQFKGRDWKRKIFIKVKNLDKSSVIGQKGESQNGGNKRRMHTKFSQKKKFLTL